jgi:hypothetical protein
LIVSSSGMRGLVPAQQRNITPFAAKGRGTGDHINGASNAAPQRQALVIRTISLKRRYATAWSC